MPGIKLDLDVNDANFDQKFAEAKKTVASFSNSSAVQLAKLNAEAERLNKTVAKKDAWQSMKQGATIAFAAIAGGAILAQKAYQNTLGVSMKYAAQVRDIAIASGANAEQTSRMLQVMDDYQISADDVTMAMKKLKDNGLSPTIETMAELSAQFLAIEDPAKRLDFAYDNLGKSGAKFLNVLAQGPDAIMAMNDAVSESLILTDQQVAEQERVRLAIDAVGDTWEGAKIQAGVAIGEIILKQQEMTDRMQYMMMVSGNTATQIVDSHGRIRDSFQPLAAEYDRAIQYGQAWEKVLAGEITPALEVNEEAIQANLAANGQFIQTLGSVNSMLKSHAEGLAEADAALAAGDISIDEHKAKLQELSAGYQEARNQIVLSIMEMKFAAEGWTDAELLAYTTIGEEMGVFVEGSVEATQSVLNQADAMIAKFEEGGEEIPKNMSTAAAGMEQATDEMVKVLRDPIAKMTNLNEKIEATAKKANSRWTYYFDIVTTGRVPSLPTSAMDGGVVTSSAGGSQLEQRYASGGYGLSNMPIGAMASVGELGEEGIVQTRNGLYVVPAHQWRGMKGGSSRKHATGSGRGGGPLTGEELRQARISRRMRLATYGGSSIPSSSATSISDSLAEVAMSPSGALSSAGGVSGGAGSMLAAAASQNAMGTQQSVQQLQTVNQNLETLIAITTTPQAMQRILGGQNNKYS